MLEVKRYCLHSTGAGPSPFGRLRMSLAAVTAQRGLVLVAAMKRSCSASPTCYPPGRLWCHPAEYTLPQRSPSAA